MIVVHHLNNSRSQRILWLLEELKMKYEVVRYERDLKTRLAPPELMTIHPLGKSPVVQDGKRVIAESGAIIEYLISRYGRRKLAPSESSPEYADYLQWLHYAEGSAMLPLMLALYVSRLGDAGAPLHPRIDSEVVNHLGYINLAVAHRLVLVGKRFTGADIQMTFVLEAADARGRLEEFEHARRYLRLMQGRPAYKRAIERGGPYQLGG